MQAVIKTGGKQYRVNPGDVLKVEKLDAEEGGQVEFDQVLLISGDAGVTVGNPLISGAKVTASVLEHGRGKKIRIIKFKRRKHHLKRQGHRQYYTKIQIADISAA